MIIQLAHLPVSATKLPLYLGSPAASDEIIGVGQDSVFVMDDSLHMITYHQAMQAGLIADVSTISHPSSFGYSETLRQLHSLASTPEQDDLGRIRPSETAIDFASSVAFKMLASSTGLEPPADVSTDRDGDVRVVWESGGRTLELVCPYEPSHRAYIYYSDGTQYAVAYDLSVDKIGRLLRWLAGAASRFPL